jgi:hypothetical protein
LTLIACSTAPITGRNPGYSQRLWVRLWKSHGTTPQNRIAAGFTLGDEKTGRCFRLSALSGNVSRTQIVSIHQFNKKTAPVTAPS